MLVEYSGYKAGYGSFAHQVYVDENRTDYEIHYKNGMIAKQNGPFESVNADWNHDGDVYTQFGAWFSCTDKDGNACGGDFWTPVDMVSVLVEAKDKPLSRIYDNEVVDIPGIKIPMLKEHDSLEEQLKFSEKKMAAFDIEKNKKMHRFGVRGPNEPWAR